MSFICYLLLFHFQEKFQCNDAKNVMWCNHLFSLHISTYEYTYLNHYFQNSFSYIFQCNIRFYGLWIISSVKFYTELTCLASQRSNYLIFSEPYWHEDLIYYLFLYSIHKYIISKCNYNSKINALFTYVLAYCCTTWHAGQFQICIYYYNTCFAA